MSISVKNVIRKIHDVLNDKDKNIKWPPKEINSYPHHFLYLIYLLYNYKVNGKDINLDNLKNIISGCWVVIEGREIYDKFLNMAFREKESIKIKVSDPLNKHTNLKSERKTNSMLISSHGIERIQVLPGVYKDKYPQITLEISLPISNPEVKKIIKKQFDNVKNCKRNRFQLLIGIQPGINDGTDILKSEFPLPSGKTYTWFQLENAETISLRHAFDFIKYITEKKYCEITGLQKKGNVGPCGLRCNLTECDFYKLGKDYPLIFAKKKSKKKIKNDDRKSKKRTKYKQTKRK